MNTPWTEPQAEGIEVEETGMPLAEFEELFGHYLVFSPGNDSPNERIPVSNNIYIFPLDAVDS